MKIFILRTLCLSLILIFISTGPAISKDTEKIQTIKIATPLWVGQTNSDGTGLFFEIVKAVYEPESIQLDYHFVPWKRAQVLVKDHNADAMLCVWKQHAEEENQIIPDYPLFIEHTAVIFLKGRIEPWEGIQSLNGRSAVWLRGYDYHRFEQFSKILLLRHHEVDTYEKAWMHLELGRYDAYIDALIDLDIYIKENAVDMQKFNKKILWAEKAYIAFSKTQKSEQLIDIYNRRIKFLFETGRLQQIYDRWNVSFYPEYWKD